ncbi:hypothetical protein [Kitasatospora aureofaciens]|uniref:hypothetical protein n=1 Tax=Kitasatospora aureofaciens TaxID=1894 RepID=UPI00380CE3BA
MPVILSLGMARGTLTFPPMCTGYSSALGALRLGERNLVSIEVDPGVAERAAASLKTAGFSPALVVGNGLAGHEDGGPYDRLIATCSIRHLPLPWLYQVTPEGKILVTFSGWSFAFGQALLTVTEPGCATGRFLPGQISYRDEATPRCPSRTGRGPSSRRSHDDAAVEREQARTAKRSKPPGHH